MLLLRVLFNKLWRPPTIFAFYIGYIFCQRVERRIYDLSIAVVRGSRDVSRVNVLHDLFEEETKID